MTRQEMESFIHQHQNLVYTVVLSYVHDPHAAEDVSQEVFIQAVRAAPSLREEASVKTWLSRIARNKAIDHLRSRRKLHLLPPEADLPQEPPADADPDRLAAVERVLRGLREDYRQIVLLRYVRGLSYAAIGRIVGLKPMTVGEKLHRVWKIVRENFKEACHDL
jgi:RNA polymerase sigma-70 factor (ECF subfamily)